HPDAGVEHHCRADGDATCLRSQQSGDAPEQSALAGAAAAKDRRDAALVHRQCQVLQHPGVAEAHGEPVHVDATHERLPVRRARTKAGMAASSTRLNAYGAAWLKDPTVVKVHISVASVSNPVGLSIRVAGSSFIAVTRTSSAPARMPGADSLAVTRHQVAVGLSPRVRATSSRFRETCAVADRIDPIALDRKSTA